MKGPISEYGRARMANAAAIALALACRPGEQYERRQRRLQHAITGLASQPDGEQLAVER